jgi:hypothetical protein
MSFYRVYEIDNLYVGELNIQQSITSTYPSAGTVLYTNGSGGTFWSSATAASGSNYFSLSTGTITLSSIAFIDSATTCTLLMMVSSRVLYFDGSTIQGGGDVYNFYSSIQSVSTLGTTNIYGPSSNVATDGITNFYDAPSTVITTGTTNIFGSPSNVNTVGTTNIYTPVPGFLSTFTLSTGNIFTSSINLIDGTTRSTGFISLSSGVLKYNNSNLIPSIANLVSTSYLTTQLGSTVIGLGTAGYISTLPSLANLVSTANLVDLVSTANLANLVSTANLVDLVSTANLANLVSTANFANLVSTANLANLVSSANLANLVSTANLVNLVSTANLANLVSTANLANLVSSANLANLVSSANLANLVSSANLANLVSTANLVNLVSTANLADLVSTANLADLVSTANLANLVSTANLADLVSTANLADLVSTANLTDLISTANLANLVSTANLTDLISTANLANLVSTSYFDSQVVSTVIGLGTIGYVSTSQLTSTTAGTFSYISSFVSSAIAEIPFYFSGEILYMNYNISVGSYRALENTSLANTSGIFSVTVGMLAMDQFIIGFETDFTLPIFITEGYWKVTLFSMASLQAISLYANIYLKSSVGVETLLSSGSLSPTDVPTIPTPIDLRIYVPYTTIPTGSTIVIKIFANNSLNQNILLTTYYENGHYSHVHTTITYTPPDLFITSSLIGLGTMGYLSTVVFGSIVSTANLANLVSTSYLDTQVGSTLVGLGTAGYISSGQLLSTTAGLSQYISSFIDPIELTSTVIGLGTQGFVSSLGLTYAVASTAQGLGTFGYTSTSQLLSTSLGLYQEIQSNANTIRQSDLTSTVVGLGTVGYLSTIPSLGAFGLVSTANLANLVSTTALNTALASTLIGLGTAGYLSSGVASLPGGLVSTANLANLVSTNSLNTSLASTVIGLGSAGYVSSSQLLSTSKGIQNTLDSIGILSTTQAFSYSTGVLFTSSVNFYDPRYSNSARMNVSAGILLLNGISVSGVTGGGTGVTQIIAGANISVDQGTGVVTITGPDLNNYVSTSYAADKIGSTVVGLGTAGYISTAQLLSTTFSYSQAFTTLSANISTLYFSSAVANTAYISSLTIDQLTFGDGNGWADFGAIRAAVVSSYQVNTGIVYAPIISTQQIVGVNFLTQANLTSTVIGLGTTGYLSTAITNLGGFGLVSTANLAGHVSTANLANLVSTANLAGHVSTANLATLVSTTYLTTQLGSTVIGLGTAGYLSSIPSLGGFVSTANLAGHVSTANLATLVSTSYLATQLGSTVIGLGTAGYLSSAITNLGGFGLVSTANLAGHVSTANLATLVSTSYLATQLGSTVIGLGTAGYLSSAITNLGGFGLVSTANLAGHVSTANLANLVSTSLLNRALTSTVIGLGTAGYLSSAITNLGGFGLVSTANLRGHVSTGNLANLLSTANLANLVSTTYLQTQLGSTMIGLGTAGYISSGQLLSTTFGLSQYISSFIDPNELTSTVIGLGTLGFVSSLGLTYAVASTAQGLGTFGYTSTSQLLSTSLGLYQQIQNSGTGITQSNLTSTITGLGTFGYISTIAWGSVVSTANLAGLVSTSYFATQVASTVIGLGTAGYLSSALTNIGGFGLVSTANFAGIISTANLANHISTANLATLVSTSYLATQLGSTVRGLGSAGYISSGQLLSTTAGLSQYISSFIDPIELTSTVIGLGTQGFVSSLGLTYAVASTAQGLGTFGYTSTSQLLSTSLGLYQEIVNSDTGITQSNLTSTITGLGTFGYISTIILGSLVSTANLANLVSTANLANHISTANLATLVSTSYLATQLGSTVRGLGTAGYISTALTTLPVGIISTANLTNLVSTANLANHVSTANLANLVSTNYLASQLGSTVIGLGTTGYLSSIPSLGGFVSTANLTNLVSTTYLASQLASTVIGLGTTGYLSSIPSLGAFGLVSTANLANLVSTANLANHVSTANLANLVSTTYLATQLGSTVRGLGTAGYISSGQLLSTSIGLSQYISSFIDPIELTSTVIGLGTQGFVSSLGLTFAVASTAQGLGTFGYTSTSQLLSTSLGLYQEIQNSPANIKQSNVTSTIIGLGTFGYLSTVVFGSIVSTANLANHVSTANLANLVSTANLANHVSTANLANLVSTSYLTTQLGSTVIGLGTAGYISSQQLLSSFSGLSNVAVTKLIAGTGVSLSPASGIGNVTVTVQGVTTSVGNYGQNTVGAQITVTTSGPFPFTIVSATITTGGNPVQIIATGDANNVTASTWCLLQLYRGTTAVGGQVQAESSAANENIPFGITWVDAVPAGTYTYSLKANNVAGGSFQFGEATSPVISVVEIAGASPGFLSSISLFSTVAGLGTAGYLSSLSLYSTVTGLGTAGYLSSIPSLGGFVSSANLANLVSTSFLNTSLTSTVRGLGTAGYLSSIPSLGGFVSSANLINLVSTSYLNTSLTSTVTGLGSSGYISTSQLLSTSLGLYQQINSISTTTTLSPSDYVVQGSLNANQIVPFNSDTRVGFVVTPTVGGNLNYDPQNWWNPITSTLVPNIAGYYLVNYQLWWNIPTTTGQTSQVNIQIHTTTGGTGPTVCIAQTFLPSTTTTGTSQTLTTLVQLNGTNEGVYFTAYSGNPTNTIQTVGTYFNAMLIMSGNANYTANFVSTQTLNNSLTSTVIGLGTAGYLSSIPSLGGFGLVSTANLAGLVSTANLAGHVSTANLANLVSTANLANLVSTANLANLVSTSYLNTALTSTVIGLGTVGYLSSALTNIGGFGLVSTANLAGLVSTANLANLVSTSYLNTSLTSTVIGLGTAGYISTAQFLSTTNSYSRAFRTLSANISTLFFSSATGNTAYISSLTIDQLTFGDGNGWADFGAIRAAVVSSYQVNTGILYAPIISTSLLVGVNFLTQANLTSTVIGLGTTGYLSSALTNIGGFGLVSTANLTNLVSTANLARLVSTANLATLVSTSYLQTQLGSTVIGLGTVGYLSTQISSFLTLSTGNLITSSITFNSPNSAPVGNNVFVSSSLFFFNQFVIGGTRVQQPQIFTF